MIKTAGDTTRGDWISLDGSTGYVYGEQLPTVPPEMTGYFATLMQWADEVRALKIRTNADTPKDAEQAFKFRCRRNRAVPHRAYVL